MRTSIILLCLLCNQAMAQQIPSPTQFDKFINQPSIEWAAYVNDTVDFEKTGFNKLLTDRFGKKEIKATRALYHGSTTTDPLEYLSKRSIDSNILYAWPHSMMLFDSVGNAIATTETVKPYTIDFSAFPITDVTQIIFIENGQLKTYVPWVSPKVIPLVTGSGIYLGIGNYFSSCFNFKYNFQPAAQDKIALLSHTRKTISLDSIPADDQLKELYGRNLLSSLWPYIMKDKFAVYLVKNNKKIKAVDLNTDIVDELKIAVQVYDSVGNSTTKIFNEPLSPKQFAAVQLEQDWYYDHTKNIVFSKIKAGYLYLKSPDAIEDGKNTAPVLKIVFN
ncbi:hypothetical protein [Ferruginibacter sp.]